MSYKYLRHINGGSLTVRPVSALMEALSVPHVPTGLTTLRSAAGAMLSTPFCQRRFLMTSGGSADKGVKGVFHPPEHIFTSFHNYASHTPTDFTMVLTTLTPFDPAERRCGSAWSALAAARRRSAQ